MKANKLFSKVLSAVLITSMLAACNSTEPQSSTPAGSSSATQSSTPQVSDEPKNITYPIEGAEDVTLSYWIQFDGNAAKYMQDYSEHPAYIQMMEDTGVNIEFIHPTTGSEATQFGLLVSSGDFPDIIEQRTHYPGGAEASVADGLCIDLTPYLEEYAPDYYNIMMTDEMVYRDVTDKDGNVSAFHLITPIATDPNELSLYSIPWTRNLIRTDVMAEIGLTEVPVTIADYEEMFKAMQDIGLVGYVLPKNGYQLAFSQAFNTTQGFHLNAEGDVVFGQITDEFKMYVETMNDWYEKGYLYQDFLTMTYADIGSMFDSKQVGVRTHSVDGGYDSGLKFGYEILPCPYPRVEEGDGSHFELTQSKAVGGFETSITTSCEEPEIAVQFLNYAYTEAGALLTNFGVEGEAWTYVDGEPWFTDEVLSFEEYTGTEVLYVLKLHNSPRLALPGMGTNPIMAKDQEVVDLRMMYVDDTTVDSSMVLPQVKLTVDASSERGDIMADVNTYVDESVIKFITGVTDISEWDNYVAQVEALDIDRAIELTQLAYDEYTSKPYPGQ